MSCNGCRVLRKGCSESCILRPCLQWIDAADAQGHATVFVAKFFGRAGLMSFISAVPESQRPALFQSLLYEACGRTVNPVSGAVGLLSMGNWHLCEAAVETVLGGGALRPIAEDSDIASEISAADLYGHGKKTKRKKSAACSDEDHGGVGIRRQLVPDLDLSLSSAFQSWAPEKRPRRPGTSSETSAMTSAESRDSAMAAGQPRLLNLLV